MSPQKASYLASELISFKLQDTNDKLKLLVKPGDNSADSQLMTLDPPLNEN